MLYFQKKTIPCVDLLSSYAFILSNCMFLHDFHELTKILYESVKFSVQ